MIRVKDKMIDFMKNKIRHINNSRAILLPIRLCLISSMILVSACSSEWNDHYSASKNMAGENLMQTIAKDNNLSTFSQILAKTGYNTILESDQTYTVWAPENNALAGIDINDANNNMRIVSNHIARFNNPSSTNASQKIYMLNGKSMAFKSSNNYEGVEISAADISASNGILHKIKSLIPYKYNIREYLDSHAECSEISNFISTFDKKVYDATLSTTYDSVFVNYNALLQHKIYGMGDIANEDSSYVMVIPNNETLQKAYNIIAPAFTNYKSVASVADSIKKVQAMQTIVRALASKNIDEASLSGYTKVEASNGTIYLATDNVNNIDTCLTNALIKVEAENMDGRVSLTGTNTYIRTTDINSAVQGVSSNSYLEVSSGNVDGGVIFDIPNVLAQAYDIYVDFVSPKVDGDAVANQLTKVSFQLRYMNETGKSSTLNNNTATEIAASQGDIISIKAFSNVAIPVADYYDKLWLSDESNSLADTNETTTLQVKTRVTSTDARNGYIRTFRIDRIRFVPINTNK